MGTNYSHTPLSNTPNPQPPTPNPQPLTPHARSWGWGAYGLLSLAIISLLHITGAFVLLPSLPLRTAPPPSTAANTRAAVLYPTTLGGHASDPSKVRASEFVAKSLLVAGRSGTIGGWGARGWGGRGRGPRAGGKGGVLTSLMLEPLTFSMLMLVGADQVYPKP